MMNRRGKSNNISKLVSAVVADSDGKIFELDGYASVGMAASELVPLTVADTQNMPFGSELMFLPDRIPILFNQRSRRFETLAKNPYQRSEKIFPVAAFNSPGYVITHNSAFKEKRGAGSLPLFSYGAVGWHSGRFRSAVVLVDRERRQDLRLMKQADVLKGVEKMRNRLPGNRLRRHLETCALAYGCPAGKNFFLGRYEAPLPTAKVCNANCLGCLSLQTGSDVPCSQERINFTPYPEEIASVALEHIRSVKKSVVSFGQGCEGDPLLAASVIEPAVRLIRNKTGKGTINMNTNGSLPGRLHDLLKAGLDSVRISINSLREKCYSAYFRPKGYGFSDVLESIRLTVAHKKHVALNYLNLPGFSDTPEEIDSLISFLSNQPIHQIQWRNLNIDPLLYIKAMQAAEKQGRPVGIRNLMEIVQKKFPQIKLGYFNPPKEKW